MPLTLLIMNHPVELLCRIFSYLDLRDLYHCSLTCRFLRTVIEDSVELQLHIQLTINRMVCFEPATSEPPISTRLEQLKRYQRAWRYLQWNDKVSFPFEPGEEMYEYVGGVYSVGNFQSVSMIQLHFNRDREESPFKAWSDTTEFSLCEYTTDSTQDLIVLVEISPEGSEFVLTSHMRTMSTNKPHPRAATVTHGSLVRTDDVTLSWRTTTAQIAGDFIALLTRDVINQTGSFIEIWNWTKVTTAPHRCELIKMEGIDDMSFLSANTFLITCPSDGYIEIYEFDDPAVSHYGPTSKATFELPMLHPWCTYSYLHASSYPVVGQPCTLNPIPSIEKPLFYPSPENRICAVHIPFENEFGQPVRSTLLIHSRVFFGLDPCVSASRDESQSHRVPWEAWGPQNTRWYLTDWSGWRYASYGLKVIDAVGEGPELDFNVIGASDRRLRLRDFNPYALATSVSDEDATLEAWQRGRVVTESSRIPAGMFFMRDVETHLPFREVVTEESFDLTEVMMDEEQIVLLKRMGSEQSPDKFTILKI